jgi:hypothetical protein
LRNTFVKAGTGIVLAAVTTAVAFFVLAATGSKAFGQFGFVMGTGILMCLLAMIFILPSLLYWFGKRDITRSHIPNINYDFLAGLGRFVNHRHWVTLGIAGVVTVGLLLAALYLNRMETDFMKLEPQSMPSLVQYRKVMDRYDMTPFPSMVVAESLEEARELTEALEEEPLVAEVRSRPIGSRRPDWPRSRKSEHCLPALGGSITRWRIWSPSLTRCRDSSGM